MHMPLNAFDAAHETLRWFSERQSGKESFNLSPPMAETVAKKKDEDEEKTTAATAARTEFVRLYDDSLSKLLSLEQFEPIELSANRREGTKDLWRGNLTLKCWVVVMSNYIVLSHNLKLFNHSLYPQFHTRNANFTTDFRVLRGNLGWRNRRVLGLVVPNAKKGRDSKKKKSWWKRFFLEEDGNWLGLREDDLDEEEVELEVGSEVEGEEPSEEDKFEAWRRRAEAIIDLREAQEGMRNEESRYWEDWLVFDEGSNGGARKDWVDDEVGELREEDVEGDPSDMLPERGLVETVREFVLGKEEDDLLYEDRVFRYASRNSVYLSLPFHVYLVMFFSLF